MSNSALDNVFDDFFKDYQTIDSIEKALFSTPHSSVPYDVVSLQDKNGNEVGVEIKYALANYSKEDISVDVDGNTLNVSACKNDREEKNVPDGNTRGITRKCVYNGIKKSKWQMSYHLGRNVDTVNISPIFKDGTLTLTIPYVDKNKKDIQYKITVN
jgi:HSP20 family molecular chaperone IbpA